MSEQSAEELATQDLAAEEVIAPTPEEAPILERRETTAENRRNRAIFSVPVELVVSVGRARPRICDLLDMEKDALIPLDTKIEDPVEILVGDRVLARGELHELEDGSGRLGVRLTEILEFDPRSDLP